MTTLKTLSFALTLIACGEVANGPTDPGPGGGGDDTVMPDAAVPANFTLSITNTKVPVLQGKTATVTVSVERVAPFAGAVTVSLAGLPVGASAGPVTIAAGETTAQITIAAAADAPHSLPTDVTAVGAAEGASAMTALTVTVCGKPGALDTSFGRVLVGTGAGDDYGYAMAIQPDGKVLLAGTSAEHQGDFSLLRLTRDGALDATFGSGGKVLTDFAGSTDTIYAIALQDDGKIVVAGTSLVGGSSFDFAAARYLPDGTLDPSFSGDGKVTTPLSTDIDIARAIVIQPDGKIVVAGESNRGINSTGLDFALVRYTGDGSLDPTWGTGLVITPIKGGSGRDVVMGLGLQTIDGETRIVAVGGDGDFAIARYRANGALDTTFGASGKVTGLYGSVMGMAHSIVITPTNGLFVAGQADHDFALVKLTQAGQVDASFGKIKTPVSSTNDDEAHAIALDGNNVVVAGWTNEGMTTSANFVIARYDGTGHLDPAFGDAGIAVTPIAAPSRTDFGLAMALQVDDRVPTVRAVVGGYASGASNFDFAIARYWR